MLRIKAVLILRRNATRDYLDFAAMFATMEDHDAVSALRPFDALYPQSNGESPLQQLQIQLASPLPYDLEGIDLSEYKQLAPKWHDWETVRSTCITCANLIFDRIIGAEGPHVPQR